MAITLPVPLTVPEIRVLQEFRRVGAETLSMEAIRAIKHPASGADRAPSSLVEKGYLTAGEAEGSLTLTASGREFLSHDVKPESDTPGNTAASA